ncbi:unnamed protein product [Prorocentrum cordatum]|uniref:Thioredoxin domain-containing protein n=1 Tax=Prorocentrum cordatum TaxID=2364126 RepID=A0ABN9PSX2_9DINO|nr:unnamed protein product [Polarella glacialis]|mmetsp:Transcript_81784/g.213364  ORF Transcript_81784/g.213364 Transcript_81784/m.213364 type:complete len:257 (-) Transcript_81784:357-1127(-)
MTSLVPVLCGLLFLAAVAVEVTDADWERETSGKVVLVKFYTTDCSHCKTLQPHWERLTAHWHSEGRFRDETKLVEVNCDKGAGTGRLCSQHGKAGFPTIKWGNPNDLDDVSIPRRAFEELKNFTDENLKPLCGIDRPGACDEKQAAMLARIQGLDDAELKRKISAAEEKIKAALADFDKGEKKLQANYRRDTEKHGGKGNVPEGKLRAMRSDFEFHHSEIRRKKEKAVYEVKESGLRLAMAVLSDREKKRAMKDEF